MSKRERLDFPTLIELEYIEDLVFLNLRMSPKGAMDSASVSVVFDQEKWEKFKKIVNSIAIKNGE